MGSRGDDIDQEELGREKRWREGRRRSDEELLYGWAKKPGKYGGVSKPDLPFVNFVTYKDKFCTKQKSVYCVKNEECFPLKIESTGWNSGKLEAKDGSFLAMGFQDESCASSPMHSRNDEVEREEEVSEGEGNADFKGLKHFLGQEQCFSNNFNGVLGSKTKAFMFWLDKGCHQNATHLSFFRDESSSRRGSGIDFLGLFALFACIIFAVIVLDVLVRGRYRKSNKNGFSDSDGDDDQLQSERRRLVGAGTSLEIQHSTQPPLPTVRTRRVHQDM